MAATSHRLPSSGAAAAKEDRDSSRSKEVLWEEFLRDPSKWWDHRNCRPSPRHPHFTHKITGEPLWMDGSVNPSWLPPELVSRGFIAEPRHATLSTAQSSAFVASLRACTRDKDLVRGTSIHQDLVRRGLLHKCSDALVTMYAQCGDLVQAKALLDMHKSEHVFPWTALIAGYTREGQGQNALDCFETMQHEGILPNAVTYLCTLKACAMIRAVHRGKQLHKEIERQGLLQSNIALGNALVDMYVKCRALSDARQVLADLPSRDVISWNTLIAGYAQEGKAEQALNCLEQMQCEGFLPDAVTYICALRACAMLRAADKGKKFQNEIAMQGLLQNNPALGGALVDMYAKCGDLLEAQRVLEGLSSRDVVSWSALIAGYAQEHKAEQALNCLELMLNEGILPDAVAYVYALKACAAIKASGRGMKIHDEIVRQGLLQNDTVLGNALVDMYSKCGDVSKAEQVLKELPSRDVVSWNALIAGHVQEGEAEQALKCLEKMQHEGLLPNAVTCACVLNVCSHQGLVEEGQTLFVNMSNKFGVKPSLECYTCMIDLFGRAGHLGKAVKLIQEMPSPDCSAIWHALLSACRKWADANVGAWAFEQAVKLDKSDEAAYVLMADIYTEAGMEDKAESIEAMRISNKSIEAVRIRYLYGNWHGR